MRLIFKGVFDLLFQLIGKFLIGLQQISNVGLATMSDAAKCYDWPSPMESLIAMINRNSGQKSANVAIRPAE